MGVYIKGMEMPTSCHECRMYEADIYYCSTADRVIDISDSSEGRCAFCPLVPVPPHGRLIDADALDDAFTDLRWENGDYKSGALMHWGDRPHWCLVGGEVENLINAAPTIIPAEEGE